MNKLSYFTLLFVTQISFSQITELKGRILADSLSGYSINIYNITKQQGVVSNKKGYFKISSNVRDTIIFSSIQYEKLILIVTKEHLQNPNLEISLTTKVEVLNQIYLHSVGLSGNLESDVLNTQLASYIDGSIYNQKELTLKRPISNETLITISVDLEKTINLINGKKKEQNRNERIQKHRELVNDVTSQFSNDFYTEALGIPKALISDFMFFCAEQPGFKLILEYKNDLKLVEFLKGKVVGYKKQKGLD